MRHVGQAEITGEGHLLHDQHAGDLVELEAAVLLGGVDHQQAEFGAFPHPGHYQLEIAGLDLLVHRLDPVCHELFGGGGNLPVFVGEVARREDIAAIRLPDQEVATLP
jgi:hypothetical protein